MSDKLRSYIKQNREKFDSAEPSEELWKKIDSKLEMGSKNNWISKFKYFGFGASVIVIAVYFISQSLDTSSSNALAQHSKDSALNSSGVWVKTNHDGQEVNANGNSASNSSSNKIDSENSPSKNTKKDESALVGNSEGNNEKDSLVVNTSEYPATEQKVTHMEEIIPVVKEEKPVVSNVSHKHREKAVSVPETPSELNMFNATLYDGSSLCEVIQAYKFPGKVDMNDEGTYTGHRVLKTIPCSKLENMGNVKAVWLKGKTGKKLSLSITEGLKNIVLTKKDGRKSFPVAISHYYKGLGVISDYTGKHFEMNFKENVEFILFFKDAEDGDRVMIDDRIEAVISTK